ncbi:uncharacterized protein FOMMEDRAFT_164336 [Fomitiporia mediterranea MF3/22]|uniref:uncharacterized protein n=1 Tax=Fomitiporia mediterranea (strain MF3/22) TaxID=694068 RepID=UPI000440874F|nr:uncharacterized protein FOMMEDRAFT_164336 [Fomitiporia mediterranea MF3/22]EJD07341.1 hypothetical protein FOMMEDRAFT_164336 [Fomitiporia mediterranea MF3/22]
MGFLKRFFSLRHKQKSARSDCRQDSAATPETKQQRNETLDISSGSRHLDVHAAFRSADKPRKKSEDQDADAAVSRLLRSSSARYNVVKQTDVADLPPLPHPINTVSSRSTSALTITPSNTVSLKARGSYRVTVHKRQQLSTTVFPNAYPPLTPRRPGIAHTSTPNLLATCSVSDNPTAVAASTSTSALVDPRKISFTPRDANRLSCLRQDPSVVSLVNMYDDHGQLAENAFANTPAVPRRKIKLRKSRRKSTFTELLGCEGSAEADLLWAESCIAQLGAIASNNSASNASSTSLSSASLPALDSPATSTFHDAELDSALRTPQRPAARDPSGSDTADRGKGDGFSSLVVELSTATSPGSTATGDQSALYLGPHKHLQQDKGKGKETLQWPSSDENKGEKRQRTLTNGSDSLDSQGERTLGSRVGRRPSHRASQVFKFIDERRERCKSQELLQGSDLTASGLVDEFARSDAGKLSSAATSLASKTNSISRARSSALVNLTGSVKSNFGARLSYQPKTARTSLDAEPAPAPPSAITHRPLCPIPRQHSRSTSNCSQTRGVEPLLPVTSTSVASKASHASGLSGLKSAKGSTMALGHSYDGRERQKGGRKAETMRVRDVRVDVDVLPQTSTPHPSRIARAKKALKVSFEPRGRSNGRATLGEMTGRSNRDSFEMQHDAFVASLEIQSQQLSVPRREKENTIRSGTTSRRRGPPLDLGLARAASTTLSRAFTSKYARAQRDDPRTPTRSQSLRAADYLSAGSSSELSPATTQLMADLRARRTIARTRADVA